VAQLSPQLQSGVVLHYFHDYSRDEIAAILGTPSGTDPSRARTERIKDALAATRVIETGLRGWRIM